MTAEQLVRRNLKQYQRLESKKRSYADNTTNLIYRAECLAEAAVYRIAADDMREILETAEDITNKKPAGAPTPTSCGVDGLEAHHLGG